MSLPLSLSRLFFSGRRQTSMLVTILTSIALLTPAPAAAQQSRPYQVNAGDVLEVFVWGEPKLQRDVRVLPDGTFAFPLAGTITAEGRTAQLIAADILARIQSKFRETVPEVTVTVKDPAGMRVYVVGKVRAPGAFPIGRYINALQALALAGGPSEFADVDNAVVLSETPNGQKAERVRLSDVLKAGKKGDGATQSYSLPPLRSGDVLVVP
jgi:polysaccharide export outer membrane protein